MVPAPGNVPCVGNPQVIEMRVLFACFATTLLSGCVSSVEPYAGYAGYSDGHGYLRHPFPGAVALEMPGVPRRVWVAADDLAGPPPPRRSKPGTAPPLATPTVDPVRRAFDAPAARESVEAIDFAPCTARGAQAGYGHAHLTFHPSGAPARIVIDAPERLEPQAVACIGERLGAITVPRFDGGDMTIGAGYRIP